MPAKTFIVTPLPADTSEQAVINSIHNHDIYIQTTCPQLISRKHVSGTPGLDRPCVYEIVDTRVFGEMRFKLTLTNVAEGSDAVVEGKTPTGSMTVRSEWRVRAGKLEEVVEIESNLITKMIVKKNVEKGHPEFHQYVIPRSFFPVFGSFFSPACSCCLGIL
ncbi:hypothetical protein F4782DRAFT_497944 [Xylaria castorea]|nr:hypothetical protein F4782DRAFT_497944 [Xylaria castorea]